MAVLYVRSNTGNDGNNGSSWGLAKKSISGAISACSYGDIIYVAHDHNFGYTTGTNLAKSSANMSKPIQIICVTYNGSTPTQLATTAYESSTTWISFVSGNSSIYFYGITFASLGANNGSAVTSSGGYNIFDNCVFYGAGVGFITNTAYGTSCHVIFNNTVFNSTSTGACFTLGCTAGNYSSISCIKFKGCSLAGTTRSILFDWQGGPTGTYVLAEGCDFSSLGSNSILINNSSSSGTIMRGSQLFFKNCKLSATASLFKDTTTAAPKAPDVFFENCSSGADNIHYEWYKFQGSIKNSATVVKLGGASNATSGFSWMLSTTQNASFLLPLESPATKVWCSSIGMPRTLSISFVHDSIGTLGSGDIWMELEYLGTPGSPMTTFLNTKVPSYPLSLGSTVYPIDSEAIWNTPGFSSPSRQHLQLTFTPRVIGLLSVKIYLAKPNYTVYVDPVINLN